MCVCAFIAYFQPQQRRAIFQFYLISRLISNNGTARHPQWTNAGMAATENIVAPFVKHCRRNYRCNLHAPLNWSLLSPARWFIPPSSFRFTLLSFSSHPPPPSFFFLHFSLFNFLVATKMLVYLHFEIEAAWHAACWSVFSERARQKGGGENVDTFAILRKECDEQWRYFETVYWKRKKKKGKEGGMNGDGWIRLEQCDLDIRSEERCVIRRSWSEILEIVYIRKEKRTVGSFVYIYTSVCFERAKWRRKKEGEIVSRIFDGEAQRWRNNLKLDGRWEGLVASIFFFDRPRQYKFHFQERERREIWLPVKKFIHPRNRTNIQNERRNILRNTWSKAIESGTNFHQLDPIHRSVFPVQIQLQFFHLHATSSPLSLLLI